MQADGGCLLLLVRFAVAFSSLLWKKIPLTLAFERNRLARFGNTSGFLRSEGAPAANGYWGFLVLVRFSDSVLPVRTLASLTPGRNLSAVRKIVKNLAAPIPVRLVQ